MCEMKGEVFGNGIKQFRVNLFRFSMLRFLQFFSAEVKGSMKFAKRGIVTSINKLFWRTSFNAATLCKALKSRSQSHDVGTYKYNASKICIRLQLFKKCTCFQNALGYSWRCIFSFLILNNLFSLIHTMTMQIKFSQQLCNV
jgi:hypothetical protein